MVEEPPAERPPARRFAIFSSLRYRDYRYLWLAQTSRAAAMWMEQIARPVLILQLTDSPLLVGLVVSVRWVPQLLARPALPPWAGEGDTPLPVSGACHASSGCG